MKDKELKAIKEACLRLSIVLPHIQVAVSKARAEGEAGLAVTMVTPDGSGRLTAQFEAENFFADLATVSDAALCAAARERDATIAKLEAAIREALALDAAGEALSCSLVLRKAVTP